MVLVYAHDIGWMKRVTRRMQYGRWRAKSQACIQRSHRVADNDSRMMPLRGKYEEEDDNDEFWHDARED